MKPRILVTRPQPDAQASARRLEAMGFAAILLPLTEIAALDPAFVPRPRDFDAVAATSANALRHAPGETVRALSGKPFLAVSAHTGEAARAAGFPDVTCAAGNGASLAALAAEKLAPGARLLYLAGRTRRSEFEAALAAAGISCRALETYDAPCVAWSRDDLRERIGGAPLAGALVHSPRGGALLARMIARMGLEAAFAQARFFAISRNAAEALHGIETARILVPPRPSDDALMALLRKSL